MLATLTALILVAFTFLSYLATRGLAASNKSLAIEVTGYQWWWNVKYESSDSSQVFDTADEIHVPVGRPVKIDLKAADVIHSFWVPNLTGKQDLIPGRTMCCRLPPDARAGTVASARSSAAGSTRIWPSW